jgi:chaperonin GroEL
LVTHTQLRFSDEARAKVLAGATSAHGDSAIGELVAEALEKAGDEGTVSIEEAKGTETSLEVVDGMQFDRGYLSAYFVTDPDRMEVDLDNPFILEIEEKTTEAGPRMPEFG